jgi:Flp pilus assembly pilin Flp
MRIPSIFRRPEQPQKATVEPSLRDPIEEIRRQHSRKRRGATAMEYLVVISLILIVLIVTVQQLGVITRDLFAHDANATKTNPPGSTGP